MKELFLQKEGEFPLTLTDTTRCILPIPLIRIAECTKLNHEMTTLNKELNEVKSQILVAEYSRESEIQHQDRKAQEEIASLQQLVHGKRYEIL